jgi:poly(hydroxyalkanoate) depolymerase family esterase
MQQKLLRRKRCLMAGIAASLSRLRKLRESFEKRLQTAAEKETLRPAARPCRLQEVGSFGSNPGNLRMHMYVPDDVGPSPALVIALHGCTQTAESYDQGTGWSQLADRFGFIVVFPEQQPANNPKNCFSWFLPGDTARDSGEAMSIRQMIAKAVEKFGVDRSRIFVTGLSAGGAMTSVMLATYPEIFAGGAIIAGLPYGSASSVQEAFEAMFNERAPSSRALGDHVRAASNYHGPWPKISVWHGTADAVVRPSNADDIIRQWIDVLKLPKSCSREEQIGRHIRRMWNDAKGDTRIEAYSITGMGHGVPLTTTEPNGIGVVSPFFLEAGISSTVLITRYWGLDTTAARTKENRPIVDRLPTEPGLHRQDAVHGQNDDSAHSRGFAAEAGAVIEAAFKAAGLPVPERIGGRTIDPGAVISAALKAAGLKRT